MKVVRINRNLELGRLSVFFPLLDYFDVLLYIMSAELLIECRRKLSTALLRLDEAMEMFDSEQIEKALFETCKAESVVK